MKIKVNENLTSIMNYIHDHEGSITWHDLMQYCIDYGMYEELYIHRPIIEHLVKEHNYPATYIQK